MGKKFIYNVLLNIGLIVMVFSAVSAYKKEHYLILMFCVVVAVLLSFLKIRLLKQVRILTKSSAKSES